MDSLSSFPGTFHPESRRVFRRLNQFQNGRAPRHAAALYTSPPIVIAVANASGEASNFKRPWSAHGAPKPQN